MYRPCLWTPIIPASEIQQSLVPPRIAGRCGPRGGRLRPPRFIPHGFRPGVSRRRGLRIPRFRASTKARSLRRSSFPTRNRCAGLRLGDARELPYGALTPRSRPVWRGTYGPPRPGKGAHGAARAAARGAVPPRCCLSFLCIKYSFVIPLVSSYRSVTRGGVSGPRGSNS